MKTFWQRPEGKLGMVIIIGGLILLAWVIFTYGVAILAFISTTIGIVVALAVLGAILYILFDKKFRTLVWYMYKSFMRWVTGLFVQLDPIRILESYIDFLYQNLKQMNEHIARLKGQISKMEAIIKQNVAEMEQSLKIAEQAKKQNNMELVAINTRQYGRLKETNEKYKNLLTKMQILYRVLSKIHKNSGYLIKDTENEVRMRKQEASAIKAGHSAMKSAMSIINGDPDKKMMFDMATEAIVEDVHAKIGEMERFIEISGSFIDSIDLQNAVFEQDGLDILEKMEKDGVSFLLGERKLEDITGEKDVEVEVDKDLGNISKYKDLFD
jgi:phage shock protein A